MIFIHLAKRYCMNTFSLKRFFLTKIFIKSFFYHRLSNQCNKMLTEKNNKVINSQNLLIHSLQYVFLSKHWLSHELLSMLFMIIFCFLSSFFSFFVICTNLHNNAMYFLLILFLKLFIPVSSTEQCSRCCF